LVRAIYRPQIGRQKTQLFRRCAIPVGGAAVCVAGAGAAAAPQICRILIGIDFGTIKPFLTKNPIFVPLLEQSKPRISIQAEKQHF
jgi:hypothetical protein